MNDLPSVQSFPIEKELHNSQDRFYGTGEAFLNEKIDVTSKINNIFS